MKKRRSMQERVAEIAVGLTDDGTGDLGDCIRHHLHEHPRMSDDRIREIVRECQRKAEEEHAANVAREEALYEQARRK